MKLTRQWLIESENNVPVNEVLTEDFTDEDIIDINPTTDSVSEVADAIQQNIEVETDGAATVSDENAEKAAKEIITNGQALGAEQAVIIPTPANKDEFITENRLTKVLDKALADSLRYRRRGKKIGANVLISGLPGSAKTAIIEDWVLHQTIEGKKLNLLKINAKNNKLEAAINGMPLRDITVKDANKLTKAYDAVLDPLFEQDSVLFLDEYNRQTDPEIRASLLTLINEKTDAEKIRDFNEHLLFTIAAINPSVPEDPGASLLNDAELSRFIHRVDDFDSDIGTTQNYYNNEVVKNLKKFNIIVPESTLDDLNVKVRDRSNYFKDFTSKADQRKYFDSLSKQEQEDIIDEIKAWDLGNEILTSNFKYDTRADLHDTHVGQYTLLNQRILTDAIATAQGDAEQFLDWVDHESKLLPRDVEMLHNILDGYRVSESDLIALLDYFGIGRPDGKVTAINNKTDDVEVNNDIATEEQEDDFALFDSGNDAIGAASQVSAAQIAQRIRDFQAGLKI